jgi:hypothetical protein
MDFSYFFFFFVFKWNTSNNNKSVLHHFSKSYNVYNKNSDLLEMIKDKCNNNFNFILKIEIITVD